MAKEKKSFVAYCDWIESFEELSDEEAGRLVKHLFRYVNDKNPEDPDKLTKMCFIPIKQALKRDLNKYQIIRERNIENGKKGGRPKKPTGLFGLNEKPKKAVNVNVNVNDNDNVNVINKKIESSFDNFWNLYDKKVDRKKSFEKWKRLKESERDEIIEKTPEYVKHHSEIKYRKNPVTFLNNRSWEDEIKKETQASEDNQFVYVNGVKKLRVF